MLRLTSKLASLGAICVVLSACAMPVSMRVASLAADGISYLTTEKSVMDHSLSIVSGQDCAVLRMALGEKACRNNESVVDFNGNLSEQTRAALTNTNQICDTAVISRNLPNKTELNKCVDRLVQRYGSDGAIALSDQKISRHIGARQTNEAGVWIGIQVAVRQSL